MARKIKQNHKKTDDINLTAALIHEPTSTPTASPQDPTAPHKDIYNINTINKNNEDMNRTKLSVEDISILELELNSVTFKTDFTPKEKKFLELFLSSNYSQQEAVRKAGYTARHKQSRNLIAKRIIEKYCLAAESHKEIFRQIGFSEAKMALMLFDLAQSAKSENVRLQALNLASKCLGLQHEVIEGSQGIQITFEGMAPPAPKVKQDKVIDLEPQSAPLPPGRKLQITK